MPGGSSGGSAAAVASGEAAAALGSDTGGSVRQPASFCGLVGLKPTYGRISRYGLVAFASSLDQIGPMTRSVEDCALLTKILAGYDSKDATVSDQPVPDYTRGIKRPLSRLRVGILDKRKLEAVDPEVFRLYQETLSILKDEGAQIFEIPLPLWEYALSCYYVIAPSEASSNLARFDGVRYGYRDKHSKSLKSMYTKTRTDGFGREVRRRILMGTFALSSGYYEAYYSKAVQVRQSISQAFKKSFEKVDFILTPTAPEPAFPIGEKEDPIAMYLSDIFTVVVNLVGLPALSLPVGLSREGLPVGMQIIGNFFQEMALFRLAFLLEKNVRFNKPI